MRGWRLERDKEKKMREKDKIWRVRGSEEEMIERARNDDYRPADDGLHKRWSWRLGARHQHGCHGIPASPACQASPAPRDYREKVRELWQPRLALR